MTFEEAVREMIKKYFAGLDTEELGKGKKKRKYTKKFFDKVAEEHKLDQSPLDKFKGDFNGPLFSIFKFNDRFRGLAAFFNSRRV